MKTIITIIPKYSIDLSDYNIHPKKINRLWTVYDETNLDLQNLKHNDGVFYEDYVHDWSFNSKTNMLYYYSRVVEKDKEIKIILDFET